MLKILIKKQMLETLSSLQRKNTASGARKRSPLLIIILLVYVVAAVGFCFYNMSNMLCAPLVGAGLGWLYFALLGIMATAFGVIGSVFTVYSSLYKSKDNDFLISMPIAPHAILFARMMGCYLLALFFEVLVMGPAIIVYFTAVPFSALSLIICLLSLIILPLLALTLSFILAWVIALVMSHIKTKNEGIIKTILSLIFLVIYFYLYYKATSYIQAILLNSSGIGKTVKTAMYPLYRMGLGNCGDILSFVIYALILLAVFGVAYLILSLSFISLATTNRGSVKTAYKEKKYSAGSAGSALLRREFTHFVRSSTYMMNCSLGTLFLIAAAVALIIKGRSLSAALSGVGLYMPLTLLLCAAVCMITTMNDLTAPSVSLEGKSIWIAQSLPVTSWAVLKSKLKLHLILTAPPAALCSLCTYFVTRSVSGALLTLLCTCCFVLMCAAGGLFINLKMPRLNWTNETVAVKQSAGVLVAILIGWAVVIAAAVIYIFFGTALKDWLYLVICSAVFAIVAALLLSWIRKRGCEIFETL